MKLYYSPGACSLAPNILMHELGIAFNLERVDNKAKTTKSGENFWDVNPKGVVPVLKLDDGQTLTEAVAILIYLADRKPEAGLLPKHGTIEYYRELEWLIFITTEIHKQFTPLFKDATPADYKLIAKKNLMTAFGHVDKHLTGKQFMVGEKLTVADIYLFVVTNWSRFQDIDVAQWPNLKVFQDRMRARPQVQEAMKAEGLIKAAA